VLGAAIAVGAYAPVGAVVVLVGIASALLVAIAQQALP